MARKLRFLIIPFTMPISSTAATSVPSTPSRKLLLLHSFRIHLFIWRGITVRFSIVEEMPPPPTDTVHFIFQILQTFVIIHFLLLCVHSINVIYEGGFCSESIFYCASPLGRTTAKIAPLDSREGNCMERITMLLAVNRNGPIWRSVVKTYFFTLHQRCHK